MIGITGSSGKTSTKDLLASVLQNFGNTISPKGSFNNEIGLPATILSADLETEFLVLEMGMRGIGQIQYLCEIAKPDIGVVLKVGLAHAGEFGGIESTFKIKSELVTALSPDATFVYNVDDPYVSRMVELTTANAVPFGSVDAADYRIESPRVSIVGTSATLRLRGGRKFDITLKILGEHQLMNAIASITVAELLGVDIEVSIKALEELELAERWRMQLTTRADGVHVINDAYNASPDSMKAALQTLAELGRQALRAAPRRSPAWTA